MNRSILRKPFDKSPFAAAPPALGGKSKGYKVIERLPNLFVIGAPKCGTTSLYAYLRQHPQIFLADPKEPNHFAYASNNPYGWTRANPYRERQAYLSLFQPAQGQSVLGEASTCYSLMPHVPVAIRQHNPDAKILAILREPVRRAWSMYLYWQQFDKNCRQISFGDFRQRFLADDLMTEHERHHTLRVSWLRGAGMYWANLQHYYREFPANQIHLMQYDQFVSNPQVCLSELCQFLGVNDFEFDTRRSENRTAVPRYRTLYNLVNLQVDHPARRLAQRIFGRVLPLRSVKDIINLALLSFEVQRDLPEPLFDELSRHYRADLQQLMDNTGFDTRSWLAQT